MGKPPQVDESATTTTTSSTDKDLDSSERLKRRLQVFRSQQSAAEDGHLERLPLLNELCTEETRHLVEKGKDVAKAKRGSKRSVSAATKRKATATAANNAAKNINSSPSVPNVTLGGMGAPGPPSNHLTSVSPVGMAPNAASCYPMLPPPYNSPHQQLPHGFQLQAAVSHGIQHPRTMPTPYQQGYNGYPPSSATQGYPYLQAHHHHLFQQQQQKRVKFDTGFAEPASSSLVAATLSSLHEAQMNAEGELVELKMRIEMLTSEKRDLVKNSSVELPTSTNALEAAQAPADVTNEHLFDNMVDDSLFDNVMDLADLGQFAFDDLHQLLEDDSIESVTAADDVKPDSKSEEASVVPHVDRSAALSASRMQDIDRQLHMLHHRIRVVLEKSNELRCRQHQQQLQLQQQQQQLHLQQQQQQLQLQQQQQQQLQQHCALNNGYISNPAVANYLQRLPNNNFIPGQRVPSSGVYPAHATHNINMAMSERHFQLQQSQPQQHYPSQVTERAVVQTLGYSMAYHQTKASHHHNESSIDAVEQLVDSAEFEADRQRLKQLAAANQADDSSHLNKSTSRSRSPPTSTSTNRAEEAFGFVAHTHVQQQQHISNSPPMVAALTPLTAIGEAGAFPVSQKNQFMHHTLHKQMSNLPPTCTTPSADATLMFASTQRDVHFHQLQQLHMSNSPPVSQLSATAAATTSPSNDSLMFAPVQRVGQHPLQQLPTSPPVSAHYTTFAQNVAASQQQAALHHQLHHQQAPQTQQASMQPSFVYPQQPLHPFQSTHHPLQGLHASQQHHMRMPTSNAYPSYPGASNLVTHMTYGQSNSAQQHVYLAPMQRKI